MSVLYDPTTLKYSFPAPHPFRSERLRRTILLLEALNVPVEEFAFPADDSLLKGVHSAAYVQAVKDASSGKGLTFEQKYQFGLTNDTPAFPEMHDACLRVVAGTALAAERVAQGSSLEIHLAGGLHHAMPNRASGFCTYSDLSVGLLILKEQFGRVAYVDIDLHAGDGVAAIFDEDPDVLCASIHEYGGGFFPGTNSSTDRGTAGTTLNIGLPAFTESEVWIHEFETKMIPAVKAFAPQAVMLQMGCDAHFLDPLGHLQVRISEWVRAVSLVKGLGLPMVATGGGGYRVENVPRMWSLAVMELLGMDLPQAVPDGLVGLIGESTMFDPE